MRFAIKSFSIFFALLLFCTVASASPSTICESHNLTSNQDTFSYLGNNSASRKIYNRKNTPPLTIELQAILDLSWIKSNPFSAISLAKSIALKAARKFKAETGIKIEVKEPIIIYEDLSSGSSIAEISKLNLQISKLSLENSADLFVLFSNHRNYSSAIGVSYTGSMCGNERKNVVLLRMLSPEYTAFALTHEIAHTLGASHAEILPPTIMSPNLSSPIAEHFSLGSKEQIVNFVQNNGACLRYSNNSKNFLAYSSANSARIKIYLLNKKSKKDNDACKTSLYEINSYPEIAVKKLKTKIFTKNSLILSINLEKNDKIYRKRLIRVTCPDFDETSIIND